MKGTMGVAGLASIKIRGSAHRYGRRIRGGAGRGLGARYTNFFSQLLLPVNMFDLCLLNEEVVGIGVRWHCV